MIFAKRIAVLFITAAALILIFRAQPRDYHSTIQGLSQKVGLGEYVEEEEEQPAPQHLTMPSTLLEEGQINGISPVKSSFGLGTLKSPGEKYSRAFVSGHLKEEASDWLDEFLKKDPDLATYIYIVDDLSAPLHTPMNKGHEAMYYLTYIIDHYDTLADVNIFMHWHRMAWHAGDVLAFDSYEILQRLSSERVTREGYMNLRCRWDPGCPERLYPGNAYNDITKPEEIPVARAWADLFPDDPIPDAIGAPCCAQFAVSKERILSIPKAKFQRYRDWLISTSHEDWISGRVFEYLWHKIFADVPKLCPNARVCYCDGYGICFTSSETFNLWHEEFHYWEIAYHEMDAWDAKAKKMDEVLRNGLSGDTKDIEQMELDVPMVVRKKELREELDRRHEILMRVRADAIKNGTDPEIRAMVAGREWKPGDGF